MEKKNMIRAFSWGTPAMARMLPIVLAIMVLGLGSRSMAEIISDIRVEGNRALEEETVRSFIGSREGKEYSADQVSEDIRALYKSGFVRDVTVEKSYDSGLLRSGVVLTYIVVEKPIIRKIKYEGTKALNEEDLAGIVDIKERSVYDPAKLSVIRGKLLDEYASRGHFMATVDVRVEKSGPNMVDVTFVANEGKKPTVKDVKIFGNENISDRDLRRRMTTKPEGIVTASKYSREDFLRDQYVLDFYYEDNGYLESTFTEPEKLLTEDKKNVLLGIGVVEGPQYRVGKIDIQGDLIVPKQKVLDGFSLEEGEIFRKSLFFKDQQYLADHYGNEGYALAEIVPDLDLDRENRIANLTWRVRKGAKVYVERIEPAGNYKTHDKVIRRELTIKEGQLYSTGEAKRSEARVNRLGFFSDVQLIARPGSEPNRIKLDAAVEEKSSGSFSAGAGVSTAEEYFFTASYQQSNFLGRGVDITFQTQISDKTQTYYIKYADPYFLDSNWYFGFDVFSTENYYVEFVDKRQGASVTLGRRIPHLEYTRFYTSYSVNVVDLESLEDEDTIYRLQPSNMYIGRVSFSLDRNALNNYIDPTDGSRMLNSIEIAGYDWFGGNKDFIKTRNEVWYYQPVWGKSYMGLRGRVRFMSYDGGDDLLISERYFLGGAKSLRGYEIASVSPFFQESESVRTPIGGNKEAMFTAEYLIPLSDALGMKFAVFYDAGNVYNDGEEMDLTNLLQDWGFGLRWMSPMGPLRFELAYPLTPRDNDRPSQFVFSVGNSL